MFEKYRRGSRFSERVTLADAAVDWQTLTLEQQSLVTINDEGLPQMIEVPELIERAEALLIACQRGQIQGLTCTEDGYPIRPELIQLDRDSLAAWIKKTDYRLTQVPAKIALIESEQNDVLLTRHDVLEQLGIKRTTLYRKIISGEFPDATHLNPHRWPASAIAAEQARNIVNSAAKTAAVNAKKQLNHKSGSKKDI